MQTLHVPEKWPVVPSMWQHSSAAHTILLHVFKRHTNAAQVALFGMQRIIGHPRYDKRQLPAPAASSFDGLEHLGGW